MILAVVMMFSIALPINVSASTTLGVTNMYRQFWTGQLAPAVMVPSGIQGVQAVTLPMNATITDAGYTVLAGNAPGTAHSASVGVINDFSRTDIANNGQGTQLVLTFNQGRIINPGQQISFDLVLGGGARWAFVDSAVPLFVSTQGQNINSTYPSWLRPTVQNDPAQFPWRGLDTAAAPASGGVYRRALTTIPEDPAQIGGVVQNVTPTSANVNLAVLPAWQLAVEGMVNNLVAGAIADLMRGIASPTGALNTAVTFDQFRTAEITSAPGVAAGHMAFYMTAARVATAYNALGVDPTTQTNASPMIASLTEIALNRVASSWDAMVTASSATNVVHRMTMAMTVQQWLINFSGGGATQTAAILAAMSMVPPATDTSHSTVTQASYTNMLDAHALTGFIPTAVIGQPESGIARETILNARDLLAAYHVGTPAGALTNAVVTGGQMPGLTAAVVDTQIPAAFGFMNFAISQWYSLNVANNPRANTAQLGTRLTAAVTPVTFNDLITAVGTQNRSQTGWETAVMLPEYQRVTAGMSAVGRTSIDYTLWVQSAANTTGQITGAARMTVELGYATEQKVIMPGDILVIPMAMLVAGNGPLTVAVESADQYFTAQTIAFSGAEGARSNHVAMTIPAPAAAGRAQNRVFLPDITFRENSFNAIQSGDFVLNIPAADGYRFAAVQSIILLGSEMLNFAERNTINSISHSAGYTVPAAGAVVSADGLTLTITIPAGQVATLSRNTITQVVARGIVVIPTHQDLLHTPAVGSTARLTLAANPITGAFGRAGINNEQTAVAVQRVDQLLTYTAAAAPVVPSGRLNQGVAAITLAEQAIDVWFSAGNTVFSLVDINGRPINLDEHGRYVDNVRITRVAVTSTSAQTNDRRNFAVTAGTAAHSGPARDIEGGGLANNRNSDSGLFYNTGASAVAPPGLVGGTASNRNHPTPMGFSSARFNQAGDEFTLMDVYRTANLPMSVGLQFYLSAQPGFSGDVYIQVGGSSFTNEAFATLADTRVKVAEFRPMFHIETTTSEIHIGYTRYAISDVTIREEVGFTRFATLANGLAGFAIDAATAANRVFRAGAEIELSIGEFGIGRLSNWMFFAPLAPGNVSTQGTNLLISAPMYRNDSRSIVFRVNRAPAIAEAGVITITGLDVVIDRSTPHGKFDIMVGGHLGDPTNRIINNYNVNASNVGWAYDTFSVWGVVEAEVIDVRTHGANPGVMNRVEVSVADGHWATINGVRTELYVVNADGTKTNMPVINRDDRVFLPVRAISVALGINEENILFDAVLGRVIIITPERTVTFTQGSDIYTINGTEVTMGDQFGNRWPMYTCENTWRTYVPFRYLGEALGMSVHHDDATKVVTLNDNR
jgi:hypothetical protein